MTAENLEHYDIAVVMVTYNRLVPECLPSLRRAIDASPLSVAFVLVDNNSPKLDPFPEAKRHIPNAILIQRGRNAGFGDSCNRGAREVNADYYFFLNPDTVLHDPHALDTLHAFLRRVPRVGIAAPRLRYRDGTLQDTCRRFPTWIMPFLRRTDIAQRPWAQRELDRFLMRDFDHTRRRMVDWVQGSALLIDGKLFRELGGFDDRYFMYYEDVDLCRRSWEIGRPVYYVPAAEVTHEFAQSSAQMRGIVNSLLRNKTSRFHTMSWLKYTMKWRGQRV